MNKYSMIIDPFRSKNFAVVIQKNDGLTFVPLNEMAKSWAAKQSTYADISSIKIPDGMYVSLPKNLTKAQQIMFEDSIKNDQDIKEPNRVYVGRQSFNKSSEQVSVVGKQIRKIPKNIKLKGIAYKATAFKNRLRRSSTISAVKAHGLTIEKTTCKFRNVSGGNLEVIEKSIGESASRRVAANYFLKDVGHNRLSRRANSLTIYEERELDHESYVKSIEIAISNKSSRFI